MLTFSDNINWIQIELSNQTVILIVVDSWVPANHLVRVEMKQAHVLAGQLKVKNGGVLLDALGRDRFGQRDESLHLSVRIAISKRK